MCPFVLSTIHSSKGLEYERVILMDVADGLLPKNLPDQDASEEELEAYEEERRLFYVGMTRAKQELQIITFRKAGLESTFSQEIFPPKAAAKAHPVAPAPKPLSLSKTDESRITALARNYIPGTRLIHKAFGPGTLLNRNGDIAIISFDSGDIKKLAISTALRAKQLQLE